MIEFLIPPWNRAIHKYKKKYCYTLRKFYFRNKWFKNYYFHWNFTICYNIWLRDSNTHLYQPFTSLPQLIADNWLQEVATGFYIGGKLRHANKPVILVKLKLNYSILDTAAIILIVFAVFSILMEFITLQKLLLLLLLYQLIVSLHKLY